MCLGYEIMTIGKNILWAGLLLMVAGLAYDVMFAGIPYQDAPDDLLAEYNRHQAISNWIIHAGLLIAAIGALGSMIIWVKRRLMG